MRVRQFPYIGASVIVLIALVLMSGFEGVQAADTVYIVRKNDNLSRIASTYGLSVTELAAHNRIARNAVIYVGQRLRIPSKEKPSSPALSAAVRSAIKSAKVRKGRWKYIVLHHSGTELGSMKGMEEYHRTRRHMENGLAYHFVIGNGRGMGDGEVGTGRRWTNQINGGHLASELLNDVSIGICLVGNFDQQSPTKKQLASLRALLQALRDRCDLPLSAVRTHQQINPVYTRCPGRHFPMTQFVQEGGKRKS